MATAAIVAQKNAKKRREAEESQEKPLTPAEEEKKKGVARAMKQVRARKSVFTMFQKKTVTDTQMVANAKGKELPLRVILHVLKQRRKDRLYSQLFFYFIFMLAYTFVIYHSHKPFHSSQTTDNMI